MGQRRNRKRTRSRPRHRDAGKARSLHSRTNSLDTTASHSSLSSPLFFQPSAIPLASRPANHWHQTYSAWQDCLRQQQEDTLEAQRLRFFGGEAGDEVSLFEPMLKVVTDLFDGHTDYEDP